MRRRVLQRRARCSGKIRHGVAIHHRDPASSTFSHTRTTTMKISDKLQDLQQWDKSRAGFPGEHWLALGAGLLVMRSAGRSRSFLGRMLGRTIGGALMARAATGRDGVLGGGTGGRGRNLLRKDIA